MPLAKSVTALGIGLRNAKRTIINPPIKGLDIPAKVWYTLDMQIISNQFGYLSYEVGEETVHITAVEVHDPGHGHGSALLSELKQRFPKCIIEVVAIPLYPDDESNRPIKPSDEELESYFGLAEQDDVRKRYLAWKNWSPYQQVANFYKKNGFSRTCGAMMRFVPT